MQTKNKVTYFTLQTKVKLSTFVHIDNKDLHRTKDVLEDSLLREHPLKKKETTMN